MSFLQGSFLVACVLLAVSSVWAWYRGRSGAGVWLLVGAAFLLRLLMSSLDPFLHDWDERFHALVAKNMIRHPLVPMLRAEPVLPYDYKSWFYSHIWMHKQPLFLWPMALSMKVFGVNEMAMRLPSALLGSLVLYPIYRLGCLIFDQDTGYFGALLAAFAFYQLEQTSGAIGMDHNDVAFGVYVTASIWAYYEYRVSARPWRWLLLVGAFAGAAVLCKWLTGLLVYAAWGLDILIRSPRRVAEYGRLAASVGVAAALVLPWQLYTAWRFPLESAYERAYNARHFTEALEGHEHAWSYHFELLPMHYGTILWLILVGIAMALVLHFRRPVFPLLGIIVIIFGFFTAAATKMYSYTYVISGLMLLLAALPLAVSLRWLRAQSGRLAPLTVGAVLVAVVLADARPLSIIGFHFQEQSYEQVTNPLGRAARVANAELYRHLDEEVPEGYIVFNALGSDEYPAMFYSNRSVYGTVPSEKDLQRLLAEGKRIAYYTNHHNQYLPDYLRRTPGALVIWSTPQ